jgi:hypothetical protein
VPLRTRRGRQRKSVYRRTERKLHGDSKFPHALENFLQLQISEGERTKFYGTSALSSTTRREKYGVAAGVRTRQGTDEIYLMPKISPNSFV